MIKFDLFDRSPNDLLTANFRHIIQTQIDGNKISTKLPDFVNILTGIREAVQKEAVQKVDYTKKNIIQQLEINKNFEFKTNIPGKLKQISTDKNNTCGVNSADEIFCKLNDKPVYWQGIDGALKHISVYNGKLYGVNAEDQIFYADLDNIKLNPTYAQNGKLKVNWNGIDGRLKQISMYENTVCGVTENNDIYCKNNLNDKNWFNLPGKLKHVSLFKKQLFGVNATNDMFYTNDINIPNTWIPMKKEGKFKQVDFNDIGYCGITEDNNIMCERRDSGNKITTSDKNWKYVDSKNGIYGINQNDEIYFTR